MTTATTRTAAYAAYTAADRDARRYVHQAISRMLRLMGDARRGTKPYQHMQTAMRIERVYACLDNGSLRLAHSELVNARIELITVLTLTGSYDQCHQIVRVLSCLDELHKALQAMSAARFEADPTNEDLVP